MNLVDLLNTLLLSLGIVVAIYAIIGILGWRAGAKLPAEQEAFVTEVINATYDKYAGDSEVSQSLRRELSEALGEQAGDRVQAFVDELFHEEQSLS